jgi:tRNA-specific 2-thiouridylase
MKPLTAIAVSGGIDSLMAAHLLKRQGYPVVGIHFITGYEDPVLNGHENTAPLASDPSFLSKITDRALKKTSRIADQAGMRVELLNCAVEFKNIVVDYFTQAYRSGRTPNPCLVCNPSIKFGALLSFARKLGASRLATGHYARISKDTQGGYHLLKGLDREKDQSYFLAMMTQSKLAYACFPLGHMKKSEVRKLSGDRGLQPVTRRESQDICFIKGNTYGKFLSSQPGFEPKPGAIEDVLGNVLGAHKGLHLFTIGQRRGINCPAPQPYYVVRIDTTRNRLIVGFKDDLLSSECNILNINWITQKPAGPIRIHTRMRYRHDAAASTLFPVDGETALIRFDRPQSAIAPGQGAVFYRDDEVLGGGWIA